MSDDYAPRTKEEKLAHLRLLYAEGRKEEVRCTSCGAPARLANATGAREARGFCAACFTQSQNAVRGRGGEVFWKDHKGKGRGAARPWASR